MKMLITIIYNKVFELKKDSARPYHLPKATVSSQKFSHILSSMSEYVPRCIEQIWDLYGPKRERI